MSTTEEPSKAKSQSFARLKNLALTKKDKNPKEDLPSPPPSPHGEPEQQQQQQPPQPAASRDYEKGALSGIFMGQLLQEAEHKRFQLREVEDKRASMFSKTASAGKLPLSSNPQLGSPRGHIADAKARSIAVTGRIERSPQVSPQSSPRAAMSVQLNNSGDSISPRGILVREDLSGPPQDQRLRLQVIDELICTETDYVRDLKLIINVSTSFASLSFFLSLHLLLLLNRGFIFKSISTF